VLIVVLLGFIWGQSLLSGEDSAEESSKVAAFLIPIFEKIFGQGNVTENFIRKLAHFSEFMILGILFESMLFVREKRSLFYQFFAFLCGVAAAVTDESLQLIADSRGPQIKDVLIDTAGVLAGLFICFIIASIIRSIRKRRHYTLD